MSLRAAGGAISTYVEIAPRAALPRNDGLP